MCSFGAIISDGCQVQGGLFLLLCKENVVEQGEIVELLCKENVVGQGGLFLLLCKENVVGQGGLVVLLCKENVVGLKSPNSPAHHVLHGMDLIHDWRDSCTGCALFW